MMSIKNTSVFSLSLFKDTQRALHIGTTSKLSLEQHTDLISTKFRYWCNVLCLLGRTQAIIQDVNN